MSKMRTYISDSPEDTKRIASELSADLCSGDVVLLHGGLGAGKTQFAQGIGEALGVTESMTSPTFNIVFEYTSGRMPLYHFDLYRLEDAQDLEDIDFYALTDCGARGVAIIEWPDKFPDEMPERCIDVHIEKNAARELSRNITITLP